ncbi:MAG: thioredoxin [Flammeovirgaceae bacterium]|nr:MAG: thioredoxin [Flammeovirgaceae bacterium]
MSTSKPSFADLITGEKPVLVDFYADWCGPCKMSTPIVEEIAREFSGKLKVIKVDVDRNPALASQYQVQGVPTLMLFKAGKILWRQAGVVPLMNLRNALNQLV